MAELVGVERLRQCQAVDCRPPAEPAPGAAIPKQAQAVDYMAKDYDSFLRAMLDLIPSRVPGWVDRTEADLGMAVLEAFAYLADLYSYHQDWVANEGFLRTATQHDSVRRLLSLVDYRLDPGRAAEVFLRCEATAPTYLPAGFAARATLSEAGTPVVFETSAAQVVHPQLNELLLAVDAPSDPSGRQVTLAAALDADLLPVGSRLYFTSAEGGEWAEVTAPPAVNPGPPATVELMLASPLRGRYPVAETRVHGNAIHATHGQTRTEATWGTGRPHQTVALEFAPLTHTSDADGTAHSSLRVVVEGESWHEVEDFVESGAEDRHFRTSRDNDAFVTVHFGDGRHGRVPPAVPASGDPNIVVTYRIGLGESGLVAADTLTVFDGTAGTITRVTNPQPSFGARERQSLSEAKLVGPRHLAKQNRAVIPRDYEGVLKAGVRLGSDIVRPLHVRAHFQWSGSWTTVAVSVDLPDRRGLGAAPGLREALQAALSERKLAGYDVRLHDPAYAPLHIALLVRVRADFFARHVRRAVEEVLTRSFFAPERFGFGQSVYLSDLYATVMAVEGVESLAVSRFKRLGNRYPDCEPEGVIAISPLEIVRCDNDPLHPENGLVYVRTCGGKDG